VCIFVVYVYSTQLPAARRKARVCQLHDTTRLIIITQSCRPYSATILAYCKVGVSTRAITRHRPLRVDIVHPSSYSVKRAS